MNIFLFLIVATTQFVLGVLRRMMAAPERTSLCETCSHACIIRGFGIGAPRVVCKATFPNGRIRFKVRDCTRFVDKNLPSVVTIETVSAPNLNPPKRRVGFSIPETTEPVNVEKEPALEKCN